ncbi:hypothetical protein DFJ73DRAFT_849660 [Zopfochytrium polystomum]|nr:hypothetical protein DFJ73DRAFT_849660 [Zopfochytrium polystomum]
MNLLFDCLFYLLFIPSFVCPPFILLFLLCSSCCEHSLFFFSYFSGSCALSSLILFFPPSECSFIKALFSYLPVVYFLFALRFFPCFDP